MRGLFASGALALAALLAGCGAAEGGSRPDSAESGLPADAVAASPTITVIALDQGTVLIGDSTTYTATLVNGGGGAVGGLALQGWIRQGTAERAAGGAVLMGCGAALGELAPGTCQMRFALLASNATAGTGTLVPGAATAVVQLESGSTVVSTVTAPITLASESTPRILAVAFDATAIPIGGSRGYTATLVNPTTSALAGMILQGWIRQGAAERAAGGAVLTGCGAASGELAPGGCEMRWSLTASNASAGSGTLVPGAATAVIQLKAGSTVRWTFTAPITLTR